MTIEKSDSAESTAVPAAEPDRGGLVAGVITAREALFQAVSHLGPAAGIIILAPFDSYFEKSASNMSEVMARGGQVVFITDPDGARHAPAGAKVVMTAPSCDPLIAPLVMSAPIQLLAYHVAVHKGADVDQPRNLAKSVTVE